MLSVSWIITTSGFRHAMLDSRCFDCLSCSAMIGMCWPWSETLVSDIESRFYVACNVNYYYFRFSSRHREFEMFRLSIKFRDGRNVLAVGGNPSFRFGIAFLCCLWAELLLLPVFVPPCWIRDVAIHHVFRIRNAGHVTTIASLRRHQLKTEGQFCWSVFE